MNTKFCDYVVIGGGMAGASLALHLAREEVGEVILLERALLGSGATAFSSGGVRQQFSTALEIELSVRALEFWKSAEEKLDFPCAFTETGYLFVTTREGVYGRLATAAELQISLGAGPVEMLTSNEVFDVAPWLVNEDLVGGCWTPEDGRIVPADGLAAIARAARSAGVQIIEHSPILEIRRAPKSGFVMAGQQEIQAENVIVACGLSTPDLLKSFGFELEIRPWMIHYAYTGSALVEFKIPTTIDLDSGLTVKRDGPGLNVGVLDEASSMTSTVQDMLEDFFIAASHRAPSLVDLEIVKTLSAPADLSIDGHPYAGQLDDGLWVFAGFGGHGTMHAPVIAEDLANVIAGNESPTRLAPFDPLRQRSVENEEWLVASRKN